MLQIPLETSKKHLIYQQLNIPSPLSFIENLVYDILLHSNVAPDSFSSHKDSMISDEFRVDLQCLYICVKSQILGIELTPLLSATAVSAIDHSQSMQERVDAKIENTRQTCRSFVEQLQVSSTSLNMRVWCAYLEFEMSLPSAKCSDICKLGDKLIKALAAYISSLPPSTGHPTLGSEMGLTSNILVAIPGSLHLHWQLMKSLLYLPPTLRLTSQSPNHPHQTMFTSFVELVERLIQVYQLSLTVNSCQGYIKTLSPTGLEPTTLTVTTPYTYQGTLKPSSSGDKKKKEKSTINNSTSRREVKVMQDVTSVVKVDDVTCMNGSYQLLIMVSHRYLLLLTSTHCACISAYVMYIHILHIPMLNICYAYIYAIY